MEHDRLFKEECAAAAAAAAASGELQEAGVDGGVEGRLVDSAPPGLGLRLEKDSMHSLESLALLGKGGDAAGNNNHNLPAGAF